MTVTASDLRTNFPEFSSTAQYPAAVVNFWVTVADGMISTTRLGRQRDLAVQLFAAHNLVIELAAFTAARNGKPPGVNTGPISSKSVGPAAVSYDTAASVGKDAGHWNLTVYGTRLWTLFQMFGAGPIQLGIGCYSPMFNMGAWPGPYPWPLASGVGFSS